MKSRSCKNKGRRLQVWFARKVADLLGVSYGKDGDVASREMGQSGVDIRLSPRARSRFPFSVECKNTERWNLPSYIAQAQANVLPGTDWLLVLKRNRKDPVVCLDAEVFLALVGAAYGLDYNKDSSPDGARPKLPRIRKKKRPRP